ncbi:hypothetical protein B0T16DRAFT_206021 [Cercophora newfieldiana]|uniref:Uncharacterized protein n=1 Tax=Cercophora newfieldiana TaxID=92897 RepID=A0AA39XVG9_9PEZI|nr:hypothetical protein B0T16DRAFT_206021 [Cercophora newfieldiana]
MGATAPATKGEKPGYLYLKFTTWYYADPAKQDAHGKALAKFFSSRLPRSLRWTWTVKPDKTMLPVAYNQERNKAFTPLELLFSASRNPRFLKRSLPADKEDPEAFDALFTAVSEVMKSKKLKAIVESEKVTMVCWSLHKRDQPCALKMSRWVLPVPEKPLSFPAERIEQVLYNLVSIRMRRGSVAHACCGGGAVLKCIESQLYAQKQAYERAMRCLDRILILERNTVRIHTGMINSIVELNVGHLEDLDTELTTLVALFEEHVGRAAPLKGKWKLVQKIKSFVKGPFTSMAIDDKGLEDLKKKVRRELSTLQRTAPILTAHIRLRNNDNKRELLRACSEAKAGPEKSEMVWKLAIAPGNLYNYQHQANQLKRVRAYYEETYNKVMAEIEALNKAVAGAYAKKGDKLFNIRGKWGRFGKKQKNPTGRCHVEEPDAEPASEKSMAGVPAVKEKHVSDSSDDESLFEKAEPKWMV